MSAEYSPKDLSLYFSLDDAKEELFHALGTLHHDEHTGGKCSRSRIPRLTQHVADLRYTIELKKQNVDPKATI